MIASIKSVGLPMNGRTRSTTWVAISATVMSQDETSAAATRNITMLVLSAAETITS